MSILITAFSRHSKETDIAGCAVYRREFDVANRSMEGEYVVFVGGFAPKTYENETWMELKPDASVPHTQVQSVILIVSGSASGLYIWAGAVASGTGVLTGDIDWVVFGYQ